ncbi:MAG: YbfB/YjiJ family MFS transporter [Desulfuromonadaceae bacterium]|nr:YbfB/YjiJ family MFS transporter [Desulfuromonadaceae bacterium]
MRTKTEKSTSTQHDWADLKVLVGGICGMIVVMGIGRFAYTPILPLMQRDLGISNTLAGSLAGLNYLGYLGGALLCTFVPAVLRSQRIATSMLLLSLITTICMGFTTAEMWWGLLRLSGGVASAVLFVIISAEVGETLTRRGHGHWFGALYCGTGFGIALSGMLVPQLDKFGAWDYSWVGMGLVACAFAFLSALLGRQRHHVSAFIPAVVKSDSSLRPIWILALAYFLEGLGYIVTATFIVAIVAATPGMERIAPYTWVVVGVAAIPSTLLWPHLARRIGNRRALIAAYALQASGIWVSAWSGSLLGVLYAAFTFGGTFLGIVALMLAEGKLRMGAQGGRAAAFLTASFSFGQVLGPALAGWIADLHHGFTLPLILATGLVVAGGVLIMFDQRFVTAPLAGRGD